MRNKTSILKFRPRFLTKSRLAFTIFNSLLIGLLLIHFAASQFYDKNSDQPPNMVFPALFATGMFLRPKFSACFTKNHFHEMCISSVFRKNGFFKHTKLYSKC